MCSPGNFNETLCTGLSSWCEFSSDNEACQQKISLNKSAANNFDAVCAICSLLFVAYTLFVFVLLRWSGDFKLEVLDSDTGITGGGGVSHQQQEIKSQRGNVQTWQNEGQEMSGINDDAAL
jgi:hypothetical protein